MAPPCAHQMQRVRGWDKALCRCWPAIASYWTTPGTMQTIARLPVRSVNRAKHCCRHDVDRTKVWQARTEERAALPELAPDARLLGARSGRTAPDPQAGRGDSGQGGPEAVEARV
jgi:hypothetical protein